MTPYGTLLFRESSKGKTGIARSAIVSLLSRAVKAHPGACLAKERRRPTLVRAKKAQAKPIPSLRVAVLGDGTMRVVARVAVKKGLDQEAVAISLQEELANVLLESLDQSKTEILIDVKGGRA